MILKGLKTSISQFSVKLDPNGFISGFGLSSDYIPNMLGPCDGCKSINMLISHYGYYLCRDPNSRNSPNMNCAYLARGITY